MCTRVVPTKMLQPHLVHLVAEGGVDALEPIVEARKIVEHARIAALERARHDRAAFLWNFRADWMGLQQLVEVAAQLRPQMIVKSLDPGVAVEGGGFRRRRGFSDLPHQWSADLRIAADHGVQEARAAAGQAEKEQRLADLHFCDGRISGTVVEDGLQSAKVVVQTVKSS